MWDLESVQELHGMVDALRPELDELIDRAKR